MGEVNEEGMSTDNACVAHQIRVHLQFLGYPIANDPIYSDAKIWVSIATLRLEVVLN